GKFNIPCRKICRKAVNIRSYSPKPVFLVYGFSCGLSFLRPLSFRDTFPLLGDKASFEPRSYSQGLVCSFYYQRSASAHGVGDNAVPSHMSKVDYAGGERFLYSSVV